MTLWGVLKFARGLCAIFGDSLINFKEARAISGTVDRASIGVVRVSREPPGHALGTVGGGIQVWVIQSNANDRTIDGQAWSHSHHSSYV